MQAKYILEVIFRKIKIFLNPNRTKERFTLIENASFNKSPGYASTP